MTKTLTCYDLCQDVNKDILNNVIFAFKISLLSDRN